jgi:hypothetical protein
MVVFLINNIENNTIYYVTNNILNNILKHYNYIITIYKNTNTCKNSLMKFNTSKIYPKLKAKSHCWAKIFTQIKDNLEISS